MHSGVRVGLRTLQKQLAWIERVASKQIGRQNTETGRVSAPSTATPSTATQRQHTNCVPAVLFWPRLLGQSSKLTFLVDLVKINWGGKLSLAESLKSEALRTHFEKNYPLQKFGYIWGVKRLVCNPKNMLKLKFQSKNVRGQTSSSRGSFLTYTVGVSDQNCKLQTTIGS